MKNLNFLFSLFAVMTFFIGTAELNNSFAQSDGVKVVKRVSKAEFKKKLMTLDQVQLVDVRTANEFKAGTITGAKNIDFYSSQFKSELNQLDKKKPTLIFCHSGGRSAKALPVFKSLGFEYVLELENGYSGWVK